MSFRTASPGSAFPAPSELRRYLDAYCPATVLKKLEGDIPEGLGIFRAEALFELDRLNEALECLDSISGDLESDQQAEAERLRAVFLLRAGWVDNSILSARHAREIAKDVELQAAALAWSAAGLAVKSCWKMAETSLREAIEMSPNAPKVLMAQARVRLEADLRIQARDVYERMREHESNWAQAYGTWGCSYVAYLLGEFDYAERLARELLDYSSEIVAPLFVIGQVALAREDISLLEGVAASLTQRSPQAESLEKWQEELISMRLRNENREKGRRKRLEAFPTLVQRRNYCGPSTVELVMRYWKGTAEFSNDQIAENVKNASSGTPIYRMREFFHLAGFGTVRTLVPLEKMKRLVEAGFPVIVQEEFSNTAHVAVVIGYDDEAGCVELQDPMTHVVTRTPVDEFRRLRQTYLEAALIAFPRGRGLEQMLSRMGHFDNLALVWCDQALLALEQNRYQAAIGLANKAVQKLPELGLGWVMLCHAKLENWRQARSQGAASGQGRSAQKTRPQEEIILEARASFYAALTDAKVYHPEEEFISQFEGSGALLDKDLPKATAAFQRAVEIDAQNATNYANLAECYYRNREFNRGFEAASKALENDPGLPAANAWLARILTVLHGKNAELYAHMAVDLSPAWWVSHQALAEAYLLQNQLQDARREVELALSLSPGQPEANVLRGVILARLDDRDGAVDVLLSSLERWQRLDPATTYLAYQTLGGISFEGKEYEEAIAFSRHILNLAPGDPWGLQFLAAAHCEYWKQLPSNLDETTLQELQREYERAIEANPDNASIVHKYLDYLESLAGLSACQAAIKRLRQIYPEKGNIPYWEGSLLARAGDNEGAAVCMLEALSRPDGVMNRDELLEAVRVVLEARGLEQAEKDILENHIPKGSASLAERQRALGLALALSPNINLERGRELLLMALSGDAEDALVMLRLGDISQSEEDRELCYRRALVLAPGWTYARAYLANYLIENNREMEAWEFTAGYAHESSALMTAHGKALYGMGHFEEAASTFEQVLSMSEVAESSVYVNLWLAQIRSGAHKAGLRTARKGLKLFGDDPKWFVRVAESLRELGNFEEARVILERGVRKGLSQEETLKAEYETAWMLKDYDLARHILEELMIVSTESSGNGRLGWVKSRYLHLLVVTGDFTQALQFLQQEDLNAEGWGEAAWTILLSDESEVTLELAERALTLDPEQYGGLFAKAEALSHLGREQEALAVYQRLIEVYPEEHHAYEKLALRLAAEGDLDRAYDYAERSVELGVFCPYAWATRGLVNFLCGRLTEAQEDLQNGWNRADQQRKEKLIFYWWVLSALNGDEFLAEQQRLLTYQEIKTDLERRIVALIEVMLAN